MPAACRLRTMVLNSPTAPSGEPTESNSLCGAKKPSVL